jgi:hypothetical protein
MKALTSKKLKIDQSIVDALLNSESQFKMHPKVWIESQELLTLDSGDYENRVIKSTKGLGDFMVCQFMIDGHTIERRYRNGQEPDSDKDIKIVEFTADCSTLDGKVFIPSVGKPIKHGQKAQFVVVA